MSCRACSRLLSTWAWSATRSSMSPISSRKTEDFDRVAVNRERRATDRGPAGAPAEARWPPESAAAAEAGSAAEAECPRQRRPSRASAAPASGTMATGAIDAAAARAAAANRGRGFPDSKYASEVSRAAALCGTAAPRKRAWSSAPSRSARPPPVNRPTSPSFPANRWPSTRRCRHRAAGRSRGRRDSRVCMEADDAAAPSTVEVTAAQSEALRKKRLHPPRTPRGRAGRRAERRSLQPLSMNRAWTLKSRSRRGG